MSSARLASSAHLPDQLGRSAPVVVGVLALALRVLHMQAIAATPFFWSPVTDAPAYRQDAMALLRGSGAPYYRPPLLIWVRAALLATGLDSRWVAAWLQAGLGALVASAMVLITFQLTIGPLPFRRRAAWIAGVWTAAYGPFLAYDLEQLPPVWLNLCLAGALIACVRGREEPGPGDVAAGLCAGLATTAWAAAAIVALAPLALRLLRVPGARRSVTLLFVLGFALPLGVSSLHNTRAGAPGALVSSNLGINLWLGNNADWQATWAARPGLRYDHEYQRATRAGAVTPAARECYYLRAVAARWGEEPGHALGATLQKLFYFFHGREIRRDHDLVWLREQSPTVAATTWEAGLLFPFGLLLPLAVLCPASALRAHARLTLGTVTLVYGLAIALFFVSARYRLPVVLLLMPLAAATLAWPWPRRVHVHGGWIAPALAVLAVALICNFPLASTRRFDAGASERALIMSQSLERLGRSREAARFAVRALALAPDDLDALSHEGELALAHGDARRASERFGRMSELEPEYTAPWVLLAHAHIAQQDYPQAARALERALSTNAYHREALRDRAGVFMASGDAPRAIEAFERYLEVGYLDDAAEFDLGRLLMQEHRAADAHRVFSRLVARRPGAAELASWMQAAAREAGIE